MQNEIEILLQRYCSAMDAFSLDEAISCANLPAIFVGDGKVTACVTNEELKKVFRWIFVAHRKCGYKRAEYSIKKAISQGLQGFFVLVRWIVYNKEEEVVWDFHASYNLFSSDSGLRIAAFTTHA